MRPCTVCIHPKRDEINTTILDDRAIAAHFGISHLGVYRHKSNHLPDSYTRDSVRRREDFDHDSDEIRINALPGDTPSHRTWKPGKPVTATASQIS
ncbi:MAG: hypothetical protein ACKV22_34690 [Bryobacteraceae bacterium]